MYKYLAKNWSNKSDNGNNNNNTNDDDDDNNNNITSSNSNNNKGKLSIRHVCLSDPVLVYLSVDTKRDTIGCYH